MWLIVIMFYVSLFPSRLRSQSLNSSKPYGTAASWSPQQPRLPDKGPTCARPPPLQCPTWLTNELKLQSRMECQPGQLSYQPITAAIISSASDMTACLPEALAQSTAGLHSLLFHWFKTLALEINCQQLKCFHVLFLSCSHNNMWMANKRNQVILSYLCFVFLILFPFAFSSQGASIGGVTAFSVWHMQFRYEAHKCPSSDHQDRHLL